jgi:SAM-dependent methyltransferase
MTVDVDSARRAVAANPHWYHTLELAPGVLTPGHIDLRTVAAKVLPPAGALRGVRALDVGTFDGFWAFELERRGASVVALDLPGVDASELPPNMRSAIVQRAQEWDVVLGRGFGLAAAELGSHARRIESTVYDVGEELLGGRVGFVFVGSILLHLRDPVRALERIANVMEPGGTLVLVEPFGIRDTLASPRRSAASFRADWSEFTWWVPNLAALRAWLVAAGLRDVRRGGVFHPPARPEMRQWLAAFSARR